MSNFYYGSGGEQAPPRRFINNNNSLSTRSDHGGVMNQRRNFGTPQDGQRGFSNPNRRGPGGPYNNNFGGGSSHGGGYNNNRRGHNQNDPLGMHSWHQGSTNNSTYFNKNFDKRRQGDALGGGGSSHHHKGGQFPPKQDMNGGGSQHGGANQSFQHSYKKPVMPGRQEYLAMDCEMVGTVTGESVAARVVLIDWKGRTVLDTHVNPSDIADVTDYRTMVSGITPESLADAPAFHQVRAQVQTLLQDKILVGHGVDNDLRALNLDHPYLNTRDTAYYQPFMKDRPKGGAPISPGGTVVPSNMPPIVGAGSAAEQQASAVEYIPRKLKELAKEKLQRDIQSADEPHCPIEDAMAALDLYKSHRPRWEACITTLQQKAKKQAMREQRHALRELQSQHGTSSSSHYHSRGGQQHAGAQGRGSGMARTKSDDLGSMSMHSYFYQPKSGAPQGQATIPAAPSSGGLLPPPPPGFGAAGGNVGGRDLLPSASISTNTTTTATSRMVTGLDESFSLNGSNHSFSSQSFHHPAVPAENPWSSGDEMDNPLSTGRRGGTRASFQDSCSDDDDDDFASLLLPGLGKSNINNNGLIGGAAVAPGQGLSSSVHGTSSTGYHHWGGNNNNISSQPQSQQQPTTDLIIGLSELGLGNSPPSNGGLLQGSGYNPAQLYNNDPKNNTNNNRRSFLSSLHGGSSTTSSTNSSSSSLGMDAQSFHDNHTQTALSAVNSILSSGDHHNSIF